MPPVRDGLRSWPFVLVLFLSAAGCAPAVRGPAVPTPERADASLTEAEIDAIAEVLMLEDHRRFDAPAFERLAGSGSVEVRRRAVTAAARIGDPAALPLLLRALAADPAPQVRADAAFGLGQLGDTSAAVVAALGEVAPPSWVPVRDPGATVVIEVLAALGKLGTAAAGRLVGDALLETNAAAGGRPARVAAEALLAAWRFGEATPVYRIAPFLRSGNPEIRWRAAYALMRSARPTGAPYLLGLFDDPDHRVRAHAARGLARATAGTAGAADSARALVTRAVRDEHPHVRISALGSLASYGEEASLPTIAERLRDADRNVAIAAAAALGRLGAAAAAPLADAAGDPGLPMPVRGAALAQLAPLDPARAAAIAEPWTRAAFEARYLAARALAPMGWRPGREVLHRLAADEDPRVAIAALEGAASLAADTSLAPDAREDLRGLVLERLAAPDPRIVAVAAAALAPVVEPRDRDALLRAYAAAAGGATHAARAAAIAVVETLGALERTDPGTAAAFFEGRPAPADRWIRRAAADALGAGWGAAPPAVAADDRSFYRDIVVRYVAPALAGGDRPVAVLRTRSGEIRLELLAEEAPLTVAGFVALARAGYHDAGVWHRVVPNFVLQDGAPAGHASGGPGWAIRDEINRLRYGRGVLGMALSGPDTGGSQWFITHSAQPHLDGGYTVFGRVSAGMDIADRVVQGEPILEVRIR
ncbi:MAG TPA: HEAT repeat domain-containing protein [Longimicrobiales bacterium]|nr:HEAT repeat domain-containing protein [Longimicrobiales bacterium]